MGYTTMQCWHRLDVQQMLGPLWGFNSPFSVRPTWPSHSKMWAPNIPFTPLSMSHIFSLSLCNILLISLVYCLSLPPEWLGCKAGDLCPDGSLIYAQCLAHESLSNAWIGSALDSLLVCWQGPFLPLLWSQCHLHVWSCWRAEPQQEIVQA